MSSDGNVKIQQLVQIGNIGAALVTHNWLALVQVELVGFSKEDAWFPSQGAADALASLMSACESEYGIPLSHPWLDDDWGRAGPNPHRASGKFGTVAGWFGHQDVESPDTHWDPGHFQWSRIFDLAGKVSHVPTPPVPIPPRPCGHSFDLDTTDGLWGALAALGYTTDKQGVLRYFQADHGVVPEDGLYGPVTKAALEAQLAKLC